ncbi:MAG: hypothetical protein HY762_06735 [Planctomycetes bacterium]|nr:hypothetical protein [Planctomycetota bacterium]
MPSIVNTLKVAVPIDAPPPARIVEKWARGAKSNADYTNENRKQVIPDSVAFQKKTG